MNISTHSVATLVETTRNAKHLADLFASEISPGAISVLDDIYGSLIDVLFDICGESVPDLFSSALYHLVLDSSLSPEQVVDRLQH